MGVHDDFVAAVRRSLAEQNLSARAAALRAGLPVRSVRGILDGHAPSIERAAEVASALGIVFEIGSDTGRDRRDATLTPAQFRRLERGLRELNAVVAEAGGDATPEGLIVGSAPDGEDPAAT